MDHLLLPVDELAHTPLNIPYLPEERVLYDDQGFLSFPKRLGIDLSDFQVLDASAVDRTAPFLQSWLWFGLLNEVLYVGSRKGRSQRVTSYEAFVRVDSSGRSLVTTARLPETVSTFSSKLESPGFVASYLSRVEVCLETAAKAADEILASPAFQSHLRSKALFRDLPIVFRVLLSVQLLIESLDLIISDLIPNRPFRSPWRSFRHTKNTQLVSILLQETGWTRQAQSRLPEEWITRYFLSFIKPIYMVDEKERHESSTPHNHSDRINSTEYYTPSHICHNGRCNTITLNDSEIDYMWSKGLMPVIRLKPYLDGGFRLIITAVAFDKYNKYVCISHARCAGLGNTEANSLPLCQLSRIQEYVDKLFPDGSEVPFWIDTMCLPRDTLMLNSALLLLEPIFHQAAEVLVLDPWLFNHDYGCSEDALLRFRHSIWFQRLWTIQEGAVSKDLQIVFSNGLLSLRSLNKDYDKKKTFRLLRSWPVVSTRADILVSILATVIEDMKRTSHKQSSHLYDIFKSEVHRILRLGYLAFPQYRYLRSIGERVDAEIALEALYATYSHVGAGAERLVRRSTDQCRSDLQRLVGFIASRQPMGHERELIENSIKMM